jgi:large subunit ribosomal protein L30
MRDAKYLLRTEVLVWKKYLEVRRNNNMSTIKIKQVKSRIGAPIDQKGLLDALGLRKMNRVVEHESYSFGSWNGRKGKHLVTIVK